MAEVNKNKNTGYLYPNEKKNERQPDFRGKVTIEGKEYLLSAWKREKDNAEILSISVTDPATLPQIQNKDKNESNKSDPHPDGNDKKDSSDGFPDPEFFTDLFSTPQ